MISVNKSKDKRIKKRKIIVLGYIILINAPKIFHVQTTMNYSLIISLVYINVC